MQQVDTSQREKTMRFFDYAESTIMEWISAVLKNTIDDVFVDYKKTVDILAINENGNQYNFYLKFVPSGEEQTEQNAFFPLSNEFVVGNERIKTAVADMISSVLVCYEPIMHTCKAEYKKELMDIRPVFTHEHWRFKFTKINMLAYQKNQIEACIMQIRDEIRKLTNLQEEQSDKEQDVQDVQDGQDGQDGQDEIEEKKKTLLANQIKLCERYNAITEDSVEEQQKQCDVFNARCDDGPFIHICVDINVKNEEASMSRLPTFGEGYTDPDDETLIDQLKKEFAIE